MTTQPNDGGPAFPNPALANEGFCPSVDLGGMSLRDWFAGQILSACFLHIQSILREANATSEESTFKVAASAAYEAADAMIAARGQA